MAFKLSLQPVWRKRPPMQLSSAGRHSPLTRVPLLLRANDVGARSGFLFEVHNLGRRFDRGFWPTAQEPLRRRAACLLPARGQAAEVKVNDRRGVKGQPLT